MARLPPPEPAARNPMRAYQREFCEWTVTRGLSPNTARLRQWTLDLFIAWCDERGLGHPGEITRPILQRYQRHLYLMRTAKGKPLALTTQLTRLSPLVAFFKWLTRENHILSNPAADLELPRRALQLPKNLLTVAQVHQVINQPDVNTPGGVRERAVLETLYSCGVRRSELMRLMLHDVDTERGTLMVRCGKGRRDRLIPLGERACAWVARYLIEVRPELVSGASDVLFLSDTGEPYQKDGLSHLVSRHMRAAGLARGSCHALRHAMATHMLENGADTRFIQAILGHAELSTTQIYTHVVIGKLQAVHALTHPARVERAKAGDSPSPAVDANDAAAALLDALTDEAKEDEA